MISVTDLRKQYDSFVAVDNLTFNVEEGEVLGFLGPNGAGKTTTMRMLTGFMPHTAGSITINGVNVSESPQKAQQHIGYLPENNPLPELLQIHEYLSFVARSKGIAKADIEEEVKRVVGLCDLAEKIDIELSNLSKGWKQRVGLAAALLGKPKVLILDEPTSGLDPNQALAVRQLIKDIGKETTILFSTHLLREVEEVCDRAMIIERGKMIAQGSVAELMEAALGQQQIQLEVDGLTDDMLKQLEAIEHVTEVKREGQKCTITATGSVDIRSAVYECCVTNNWQLLEMHTVDMNLEDIFHRLTASQS